MRKLSVVFATVLVAACGTDPMTGGGDDDMGGGDDGGDELMPPARGFQVISPDIEIPAGEFGERTFCYYFKTPNTEAFSIKRWVSKMAPGSHHMILYFTSTMVQPEGTVTEQGCGGVGGGTNVPSWIYAAQTIDSDMALPADDGNGNPLGMDVPPGQPAFIQMHYYNATDLPIKAHVTVNAEAHDAGVNATKTAAYVTFNGQISIPAAKGGVPGTATATQTCNIPATSKVWLMSTHAHKQAIHTEVRDGMPASTNVVFSSNDWEHPGVKTWMANPFYTFASGKITYECKYSNPGPDPIMTGDSAKTDEMCMATGYIFPATKATICYNSFTLP